MNITVLTFYDAKIASWAKPIAEWKRAYCQRHGYRFVCHTDYADKTIHPGYSKMPAILEILNDCENEWIFWSDADSLIVNEEQKLEPFIDENFFLILAGDILGQTTSNFFIRNSEWSRKLLEKWIAHRPRLEVSPYEQAVLGRILGSNHHLLHRIKLAGDRFNSHPLQRSKPFIVHMGGWSNERRIQYVKNITNPKLSYSQYGEDIFISEHFKGRTGTFLEIGALDGIKDSNCRKLAQLGWSGVAVEPNPDLFRKLMKNYRGYDVNPICALVTGHHGLRTLHLNPDGLTTSAPEVFHDLSQRIPFYGFCYSPCITPDDIVNVFGNHFDFVSIDAEGMDTEIVRSAKNLLTHTELLCVEAEKPGRGFDADYQSLWEYVLQEVGFTHVLHKTKGNVILKRP